MSRLPFKYASIVLVFLGLLAQSGLQAQVGVGTFDVDYRNPRDFVIGGISVEGARNFDAQAITLFSGLSVGQEISIPGEKISQAIKNLWKQKLFDNIQISIGEIRGKEVFLVIQLEERARLSRFKFEGVSKGEAETLREKINLIRGTIVNENLVNNTSNIIRNHFTEKGFLDTKVTIGQYPDTLVANSEYLVISVEKNDKIKIGSINFYGVDEMSEKKLRKSMKKTKEKNITRVFSRSKYIPELYTKDKTTLIEAFNEEGYRNAKILSDSVSRNSNGEVVIDLYLEEGFKFYYRSVTWVGNTKYNSARLSEILAIEPGEIYDKKKFESALFMNPNGGDVSSLYLDDGYLAFQAIPVEKRVENDSIDIEVRIYEGRQYRINNVIVKGNTKTNDRVIMREIRTKPGDLFSRSDIIRTQRELAQLGYFDPEAFDITPVQNDQDGTVDIIYTVSERPSDQIELSGGWGAGRIVGTVGVSFTNFSIRNFFNREAWTPLPSGDGQRFSIRAQTNGAWFQSYNASFTEPWLGGKKPNSFTVGLQRSVQTNGVTRRLEEQGLERQALYITGGSVSLGKRLAWPDDYFSMMAGVSYLYYDIRNFTQGQGVGLFALTNGISNNLAFLFNIGRNSVFDPIYPRYGSNVRLNAKITPPFSLWDGIDYASPETSERQRNLWTEYYKWKLVAEWYTELAPKLVLMARSGFGFMGYFNRDKGISPFERFYLGGVPIAGFALDGRELIALRGYNDLTLSPQVGSNIVTKHTLELRYPISLNPSATIFALGFAEAGNTYNGIEAFDPFRLYRGAGLGLRIFLPMFGLMGLDYGWRFDDVPGIPNMARSQFHFTIGMNLGEL